PPVRETDAALFFDDWMDRAPRLNALGLRAFVWGLELAPLALGFGARLRRLAPDDRVRYLARIEKSPAPPVRALAKLVKGIAFLCYYGDDALMLRLGYDADANVRRGRELRAREGRP
ncbi:MAG: hypothetical protein QOJ07_3356, partial [Thermoleophilaceae bacterium]|nr:hypothetical protein [Thermoleophilaceae bacterium]